MLFWFISSSPVLFYISSHVVFYAPQSCCFGTYPLVMFSFISPVMLSFISQEWMNRSLTVLQAGTWLSAYLTVGCSSLAQKSLLCFTFSSVGRPTATESRNRLIQPDFDTFILLATGKERFGDVLWVAQRRLFQKLPDQLQEAFPKLGFRFVLSSMVNIFGVFTPNEYLQIFTTKSELVSGKVYSFPLPPCDVLQYNFTRANNYNSFASYNREPRVQLKSNPSLDISALILFRWESR